MKITLEFEDDDRDEASRAMHCNDAWALIDDIDSKCRAFLKYEESQEEKAILFVESIRESIWDTRLLEYWN